ncbi:hypothetical protein IWW36_001975 [Coemansia brasiliensis]|uniref:Uncharacterized protein n=1 Tax=Coemansia brasiliensis TaxID=2650707 RepID=A0A9W8IFS7_9FUNG|nr:hypothetical protein IWW36_001975 [Coemansia brasiliensis]
MFASLRSVAVWRQASASSMARGISTSRMLAKNGNSKPSASENKENDETQEFEEEEIAVETQVLGAEPVKSLMPEPEKEEGDSVDKEVSGKDEAKEMVNRLNESSGGDKKWLGFNGWLKTEGAAFKDMRAGNVNYVGVKYPFPLNPFFRPRPPVSDSIKEAIYSNYLKDPVKVTPRFLADKYGISIKRVEAIIKLKAIEHHQIAHKEIVPQVNLTKGMESMLGVNSKHTSKEKAIVEITSVSGPRFQAVPEGETFKAVEAAEVLGRQPYQQIVDRLAASKPFTVDYEGLDEEFAPRPQKKLSMAEQSKLDNIGSAKDEVVEKNDALTSQRWKFVFTDIGKNKDMKDRFVLIREKDGTLKKANRDYKLKRYGQLWFH